jgi:DNA-directed RNA polymerase specialized sigma24 family protein
LPLTGEKLDALLKWLDSDPEAAARRYTFIQTGLIAMFAASELSDAEGLADEVINRVADKVPQIGPDYDGDPAHYFRGVARKVIFEARRRKEIATDTLPERPTKNVEVSEEYKCLVKCLEFLTPKKREFILDYHVYDGADKISNHVLMAEELNVSVNALRVKAHRLRIGLEKCVSECIERLKRNENLSKCIGLRDGSPVNPDSWER